jgi:hypothetical protein
MRSATSAVVAFALLAVPLATGCASSQLTAEERHSERYSGNGVSFRYPDTMALEFTKVSDVLDAIVVGSDNATALIGVTKVNVVDAAQMRDMMWAGIRATVFRNAIVDDSATQTMKRTIAGHEVEGRRIVGRLDVANRVAEIYAVDIEGKPVGLVFIYPEPETEQDAPMFDLIARTLAQDTSTGQ